MGVRRRKRASEVADGRQVKGKNYSVRQMAVYVMVFGMISESV